MKSLCIFLALIALSLADPQIIRLNKFNSDNGATTLAAETGGNLYLASSDDVSMLKNIQITTGARSITLDQLVNGTAFKITDKLSIKSGNSQASAADLTGFLYVTTALQANDDSFSVIVVNGPQSLSRTASYSTTVVLNTHWNVQFPPFSLPDKTTYVTDINQPESTNLNFHHEIPPWNWTVVTWNQFFENPQMISKIDDNGNLLPRTRTFFSKIEPLQINVPYWYITSNGPFSMTLDSKYENENTHTTTTDNATGLYVVTDVFMEQNVYFTNLDMTKKRWTGTLTTSYLNYPMQISFLNEAGGSSIQKFGSGNSLVHGQFVTDFAATHLYINATALNPGTLYLQYFVFSGDALPSTTSTTSSVTTSSSVSTTTVITTTKSSRSHDFIAFSIFASIFSLLRR